MDEAVEKLYGLSVGAIGRGINRHERPHKPTLLLSALDLIAIGAARPDRIPWSQELRGRFAAYFEVVRRNDDQTTPENPFYYLKGDGFWEPIENNNGVERPLARTPTVAQSREGNIFARLIGGMEGFFATSEQRTKLREALISRFFPTLRPRLTVLFVESGAGVTDGCRAKGGACNEDEAEQPRPARDAAFRRIVLAAYDFQCAACGLRIKLPDADVTFVDGAHLIPFGVSRNDHPTNGLALCKNHHWAMDRYLIVPTPEGVWRTSRRLDARRSPGEQALVALHEQPLLPPHDDAFRPDPVGLTWRAERIFA